jgi:two-component system response regulator FimZ (fimbrial Z protein)
MNEYKILIADDHSVVRQGVSILLKDIFDDISIRHCSTFIEVLSCLAADDTDLVILDISIPEGRGVQMIPMIREIRKYVSILIFTAYEENIYGIRYYMAGANGYVNKLSSDEEFRQATISMRNKQLYFSKETVEKLEQLDDKELHNPLNQLSPREMEIAQLMIRGEGNLEIANRLNLQNSTVSTYKNRIFEKLDITHTMALFELFKIYSEEFEH